MHDIRNSKFNKFIENIKYFQEQNKIYVKEKIMNYNSKKKGINISEQQFQYGIV